MTTPNPNLPQKQTPDPANAEHASGRTGAPGPDGSVQVRGTDVAPEHTCVTRPSKSVVAGVDIRP
jgi:hypothetical protein